jgi:glycosyltransferase involved in cell wall biosynthesis
LLNKAYNFLFPATSIYGLLFTLAAEQRAAVYHLHDLQLHLIGPKLKALPHRPLVIYDAHEDYYQLSADSASNRLRRLLQKPLLLWLDRWEKKRAGSYDAVIAAVDYIKDRFIASGRVKDCTVIYNYTYFDAINKDMPLGPRAYDLIYAGMMSAQRGIKEILLAIALLKENKTPVQLLLVGSFADSNFEQVVRQLIRDKQLADCVTVKGQVPFDEIHLLYEQSRAGCALFLPTLTSKILMPIKLFEYLSFGLPVISTNTGYTGNFVEQTGCGIVCDPADTAAVAAAITRLLHNKTLYHTLQQYALDAAGLYSWKSMEKVLLQLYGRLLQQHTPKT